MMEFKSKRGLHNHKKKCIGITTYNCSDCEKIFVSIDMLIQHTKRNHMVNKFLYYYFSYLKQNIEKNIL